MRPVSVKNHNTILCNRIRGYSEPYAPRPPRAYDEHSRGRYPPPGDYGSRYTPPPHIAKERIFVGGVPEGLTAAMLSTHFEQYGHVHDCYMPRDRVTQQSRGFAYVDFKCVALLHHSDHSRHCSCLQYDLVFWPQLRLAYF